MKQPGALAAWLKKARPGRCPCGRQVSRPGARLCTEAACRARYHELWILEKRGTSDRSTVASKAPSPVGDGTVRVRYECRGRTGKTIRTHFEDMVPSLAARVGKKRRCPMCAAKD